MLISCFFIKGFAWGPPAPRLVRIPNYFQHFYLIVSLIGPVFIWNISKKDEINRKVVKYIILLYSLKIIWITCNTNSPRHFSVHFLYSRSTIDHDLHVIICMVTRTSVDLVSRWKIDLNHYKTYDHRLILNRQRKLCKLKRFSYLWFTKSIKH